MLCVCRLCSRPLLAARPTPWRSWHRDTCTTHLSSFMGARARNRWHVEGCRDWSGRSCRLACQVYGEKPLEPRLALGEGDKPAPAFRGVDPYQVSPLLGGTGTGAQCHRHRPSECFSALVRHCPRHKRAEVRRALVALSGLCHQCWPGGAVRRSPLLMGSSVPGQGCTLPTSLEACHASYHPANEDRHMVCKRLTPWIRS